MSEKESDFDEPEPEFELHAFEERIAKLQSVINDIQKNITALEAERGTADEARVAAIDSEVTRYKESLIYNQAILDEMQKHVLTHPHYGTSGPVN